MRQARFAIIRSVIGRVLVTVVLAFAAWSVEFAPALAATPASGTLSDPSAQVRWKGSSDWPLTPGLPEACLVAACDTFTLKLALPAGSVTAPAGVEVGIKWSDELLDLDLYVYGPSGRVVAKSNGFFASTGESVRLTAPPNGTYRVVVAPAYTAGEKMEYEGLAEVEPGVARQPVRELLPDLVALPPRNATFSTAQYLTDLGLPTNSLSSCYPEERLEQSARRCLRFDQVIANLGDGPFELRYRLDRALTEPDLLQRIYSSDGSVRERKADTYVFHPAHAHFHYKNFAQSRLWAADAQGHKLGDKPVRTGRKNGFCMIDVEDEWFGRKGDDPRTYYFPRCNLPTSGSGADQSMINGISVGWADVYNWYLADQFIEVTGVPDGYYIVETAADAAHTIEESNEDNNVASRLLLLKGNTAQLLGAPAAHTTPSRPRIRIVVSPLAARVGRIVKFSVRASALQNGRLRVLRGARVRLAGQTATTDAHGRASLRVRFMRAGRYRLVVSRRGLASAVARIAVR
jgi:hypothetical protein